MAFLLSEVATVLLWAAILTASTAAALLFGWFAGQAILMLPRLWWAKRERNRLDAE